MPLFDLRKDDLSQTNKKRTEGSRFVFSSCRCKNFDLYLTRSTISDYGILRIIFARKSRILLRKIPVESEQHHKKEPNTAGGTLSYHHLHCD